MMSAAITRLIVVAVALFFYADCTTKNDRHLKNRTNYYYPYPLDDPATVETKTRLIRDCFNFEDIRQYAFKLGKAQNNETNDEWYIAKAPDDSLFDVVVQRHACIILSCHSKWNTTSNKLTAWFKDYKQIEESQTALPMPLLYSSTIITLGNILAVRNITKVNNGRYCCRFISRKEYLRWKKKTQSCGKVDNNVFGFEIRDKPILSMASNSAFVNETLVIYCSVDANENVLNITLWKNQERLSVNNNASLKLNRIQNNFTILKERVQISDNGNYSCVATSIFGTVIAYAKVQIRMKPVWIHKPPIYLNFADGKQLNITCVQQSVPKTTVELFRNGEHKPIKQGLSGLTYVKVAEKSDKGIYECRTIYDSMFYKVNTNVSIKNVPTIVKNWNSVTSEVSLDTWFVCKVSGHSGNYTVSWTAVDTDNGIDNVLKKEIIYNDGTGFRFRFKPTDLLDVITGKLRCTIETDYIYEDALFTFNVPERYKVKATLEPTPIVPQIFIGWEWPNNTTRPAGTDPTSENATIVITGPPHGVFRISSLKNVTLLLKCADKPAYAAKWEKDGILMRMDGRIKITDPDYRLQITDVGPNDAGSYYCNPGENYANEIVEYTVLSAEYDVKRDVNAAALKYSNHAITRLCIVVVVGVLIGTRGFD